MKTFRTLVFWLHLAAGLLGGLVIGVMCFTGAALAFESEAIAWSERDVRRVAPPAPDAARRPVAELLAQARAAKPDAPIASFVISSDPAVAVSFPLGRDAALYANPYTGEIRAPASSRMRGFMRAMNEWHRYLARSDNQRPVGKAVNGVCNLAFCFLAATGLYLWLPRTWSWRGVRAVALFNWRLSGKARDFNWHNTVGLWCAPVLIVLTLTALPISYRWAGNLIYRLAGEEAPAQPGPGGFRSGPAVEMPRTPAGAQPLDYEALIASARKLAPEAELMTFRLTGRAVQPVAVTIKQSGSWPRTATTTLTLDPYTGSVLKREGFADFPTGRQIRTWTRFLHTGQALGLVGQLVAGLACLGGCVLVYTGFALAWRRFFGRKTAPSA